MGPFEDWFFKQQQARSAAAMRQQQLQQQQQQQLQQSGVSGVPSSVLPGIPSSIPLVPGVPPVSGMSGISATQGLPGGAPTPQAMAALQAQFTGSAQSGLMQGMPTSQSNHHLSSQLSPQKPTPPAIPQLNNSHLQSSYIQNRAHSEMSPPADVAGADLRKRKLDEQDVKRVRRKTGERSSFCSGSMYLDAHLLFVCRGRRRRPVSGKNILVDAFESWAELIVHLFLRRKRMDLLRKHRHGGPFHGILLSLHHRALKPNQLHQLPLRLCHLVDTRSSMCLCSGRWTLMAVATWPLSNCRWKRLRRGEYLDRLTS